MMASGEKWASCSLSKKGRREQFVALSHGGQYVRCTNRLCGYFCSVGDLPTYDNAVQLDVSTTFTGKDSPLCQHRRPCAFRVSRSEKNSGRPYFTCKERLPCPFFLLGRFGTESPLCSSTLWG